MILSNLDCKTYYEIIGVKEDTSLEEIHKSYRSAILNFHPDKLQKSSETSNSESVMGNQFLEVQRAWEVLGDPRSRALYDNELRTLRQDVITAEDVSLEDMAIEDVGGCSNYPTIVGVVISSQLIPLSWQKRAIHSQGMGVEFLYMPPHLYQHPSFFHVGLALSKFD
ncbi:Chaperone protein DnaJ [Sesamum angolense]|uniref:Chaperone protein DnaJ n=1 Tax=Sesamum angolense TaxID=2727404 RepID=A0AAE2BM74_9LAMI|nr:Chaperone protein DnaJ [Sesamum angolense]